MKHVKYLITISMAVLATIIFSTPAMAVPAGTLNLANCAGGGLTITSLAIDFVSPVGGGSGCTQTGIGTNVSYSGGVIGVGAVGNLLDLSVPSGAVLNFITIAGAPDLHFDLSSLGPGLANTICAAVLDPNLPPCSVSPGSPFVLTATSNGTSLTLVAAGIARDGSGINSAWNGTFTTQFAGLSPAQIQTILAGGGSVSSTYSGSFSVNIVPQGVPEPTTMLLLGTGLAGIVVKVRKRRKAI